MDKVMVRCVKLCSYHTTAFTLGKEYEKVDDDGLHQDFGEIVVKDNNGDEYAHSEDMFEYVSQ